jgi:predicted Zn-dependent protease
MLSTHPLPQTRIDRLRELIKTKYPDYRQTGKYIFAKDRFQRQVLTELESLPPAKHPRKQNAQ